MKPQPSSVCSWVCNGTSQPPKRRRKWLTETVPALGAAVSHAGMRYVVVSRVEEDNKWFVLALKEESIAATPIEPALPASGPRSSHFRPLGLSSTNNPASLGSSLLGPLDWEAMAVGRRLLSPLSLEEVLARRPAGGWAVERPGRQPISVPSPGQGRGRPQTDPAAAIIEVDAVARRDVGQSVLRALGDISRMFVITFVLASVLAALLAWAVLARGSEGAGPERAYVVQPGDTLWTIASEHSGGDPRRAVWEIRKRNGLADPVITAGQRLVLPRG